MAKVKFNQAKVDFAMWWALLDSVQFLTKKVRDITPRDPKRPPKNLQAKVTWNLKNSIDFEKTSEFSYKIGTIQNEAEYGKFLEFGTAFMQPRSFVRKWIIDNKDKALTNFERRFKQLMK
jgi:HK97 gp10 family phage protein